MGLGGAEKMLGDISFELNRRGHSVKIAMLHPPHSTFDRYPRAQELVSITSMEQVNMDTSLQLIPPGIKVVSSEYIKLLNKFKPDIIHSHLFRSELLAHSVLQDGAVYFSHIHDNMFQLEKPFCKSAQKRRLSDYYERYWLVKQYNKYNCHFIAISSDTYDFATRVLPKKYKSNVNLLRNAINHAEFQSNHGREILNNQEIRMVSIGNLATKKNHKLLIEICKCLQRDNIPFTCDILGYGELEDELRERITNAGLQDKIFLRGSVPNVAAYLHRANIYVHPAIYEPFGLVILEAMAAGLPIICRNGRGNLDIHKEGETGYMIQDDNPDAFVDRIKFLMQNPIKYQEISKKNIEFSKQYDIVNYCDRLIDIYRNALKSNTI